MSDRAVEIDLRGKGLDEVVHLLKKNGFSAASTETSKWKNIEKAARGELPGPPMHTVWIEDCETVRLTVVVFNGRIVQLEPGMNLHVSERPPGLVPGHDWFVARTEDVMACN